MLPLLNYRIFPGDCIIIGSPCIDGVVGGDGGVVIPCRELLNGSVECRHYVYSNIDQWKAQRDLIDRVLHLYRRRIALLKVLDRS